MNRPLKITFIRLAPWFKQKNKLPQDTYIPFEIAVVLGMIDLSKISFSILDNYVTDYSLDDYLSEVRTFLPDLIILNCTSPSSLFAVELASRIKKEFNVKIAVYGQHATYYKETFIYKDSPIDYCIAGEAEPALCKLIENLDNPDVITDIPGINYWDEEKSVIISRSQNEYYDINSYQNYYYLPFISEKYDRVSILLAVKKKLRWAFIMTTRGCPYTCTFCSPAIRTSYGKKYRIRNSDKILDEVEELMLKYSYNAFAFYDDIFSLTPERIIEFSQKIIDRGLKFSWTINTRIDSLTFESVDMLAKAGCAGIALGLESGSPEMLKKVNKNIDINKSIEIINYIHNKNIVLNLTFIIGLPDETEEEINQTFDYIFKLRPFFVQIHFLTLYPGTSIFEQYKDNINIDFSSIAHFKSIDVNLSKVDKSKMMKMLKSFYIKYYLSPRYLAVNLKYWLIYIFYNFSKFKKIAVGLLKYGFSL